MKKNISYALVATFALFAISASAMPDPTMTGGDRDSHGCIPSAGYSWNEDKQACTRPWEDTATRTLEQREVRATLQAQVKQPTTGVRLGAPQPGPTPVKALRAEVREVRATTTAAIREMRNEMQQVRTEAFGDIKDMRGEIKNAFGSSSPTEIKDLRQQFQIQAQAIRASTTAMRAEMRDEALRMRLEVAHKQTDLVNVRLIAAIDRIQTLAERTSTALDNLVAQGINVDTARSHLAEAVAKLDSARTQAAAINLAFEAAFASSTPKVALETVRPLIKDATTTLQEAHNFIAQAIASVKPGLNKGQPATTTAE